MIEISEATMVELYVHGVGNKVCGDGVSFSEHGVDIDNNEMLKGLLMNYFFAPIKGDAYFNFCHATSLDLNPVCKTVDLVFSGVLSLERASKAFARLLYDVSDHPNIKGGELFVALFKDIVCDGEVVDGLGIFKSESRQTSIVVGNDGKDKILKPIIGINPTSPDKACLVLYTESDFGYKVCVVDNTSKNSEAMYWKEAFLQVKPRNDSYYKTRTYLDVCKQFVREVFNHDNEVDPADRVDMLNRTAQYFKDNEMFSEEDFQLKVLEQPEIVDAFKNYKDKYSTLYQVKVDDEFPISSGVVKGMAKQFKSLIKLDKNFHIYMHGNRERIEKGYDQEKKMSFYKLYFDSETV